MTNTPSNPENVPNGFEGIDPESLQFMDEVSAEMGRVAAEHTVYRAEEIVDRAYDEVLDEARRHHAWDRGTDVTVEFDEARYAQAAASRMLEEESERQQLRTPPKTRQEFYERVIKNGQVYAPKPEERPKQGGVDLPTFESKAEKDFAAQVDPTISAVEDYLRQQAPPQPPAEPS